MKKLFLFIIACLSLHAHGQILNPGFELKTSQGTTANWTYTSIVMPVDTGCSWLGLDSIAFATTNAHSGQYAYETKVATYCTEAFTQKIESRRFDIDSFVDQRMLFTDRPDVFTFYYKFFPAGGDKAVFQLYMQDSNSTPVASGSLIITDTAVDWTQAQVIPNYFNSDNPAFITMNFQMFADSSPHYGSRFLIDDIGFGFLGVHEINNAVLSFRCYPNPAKDNLFLNFSKPVSNDRSIYIANLTGTQVYTGSVHVSEGSTSLSISNLPPGVYIVSVSDGPTTIRGKFVKQ
jgi:hypothetical protein